MMIRLYYRSRAWSAIAIRVIVAVLALIPYRNQRHQRLPQAGYRLTVVDYLFRPTARQVARSIHQQYWYVLLLATGSTIAYNLKKT
jgi:hypothetical protein